MGDFLNNNSVDSTINEAYAIATGLTGVDNLTLKDIIDAGTTDGGALVGKKEQFTKALIMLWAKNIFADTAFQEDEDDPYYVDYREWKSIIQMISAQAPDVQESHAWQEFTSGVSQVGVYTVYLPIVSTKYYGKSNSWELPITISYEQYKDAFAGAEGFNDFRAYVFTVVENKIKKHRKTMNDANRNNFMAEKYLYSTTVIEKGEYEVTITTAAAATDKFVLCGKEFKWIANGASPANAYEIALPSTNNAANEAAAIVAAVAELDLGFTITNPSGAKLKGVQKDGAVHAKFDCYTVGSTTMVIGDVDEKKATKNPKGVHVFNLRTAYNNEMSPASPVASRDAFMANKECLRFMSRKIKEYARYMRDQSALFNTEGLVKFVPRGRMVLEVLAYAEQAFDSVLQSDTFHNELTALPGYRSVSAWQGLGDGEVTNTFAIDFDDVSAIDVTVSDGTQNGTEVNIKGIVAFMADKYAILHTIRSERVAAKNFDPEAIDMYFYQFRDQYMNNLAQNALVFVVD